MNLRQKEKLFKPKDLATKFAKLGFGLETKIGTLIKFANKIKK